MNDLILITFLIMASLLMMKVSLNKSAYVSAMSAVICLVLIGTTWVLSNENISQDAFVLELAIFLKNNGFGFPQSWENNSYVFNDEIIICYYLSYFGVMFGVIASSGYELSNAGKIRELGKLRIMFLVVAILLIYYCAFYLSISHSGIVTNRIKSLYNSIFGLCILEFSLILITRDLGKCLRVLYELNSKRTAIDGEDING